MERLGTKLCEMRNMYWVPLALTLTAVATILLGAAGQSIVYFAREEYWLTAATIGATILVPAFFMSLLRAGIVGLISGVAISFFSYTFVASVATFEFTDSLGNFVRSGEMIILSPMELFSGISLLTIPWPYYAALFIILCARVVYMRIVQIRHH